MEVRAVLRRLLENLNTAVRCRVDPETEFFGGQLIARYLAKLLLAARPSILLRRARGLDGNGVQCGRRVRQRVVWTLSAVQRGLAYTRIFSEV